MKTIQQTQNLQNHPDKMSEQVLQRSDSFFYGETLHTTAM